MKYRNQKEFSANKALAIAHPERMSEQELFRTARHLLEEEGVAGLGFFLQRPARLWPRDCALICQNRCVTYHELYWYAAACTSTLRARGVKPGDRVLLLVENSLLFYAAYFGIAQAGAVVVPLNTFLHERELVHIIKDAEPALMITTKAREQALRACTSELPPLLDESAFDLELPVREEFPDIEITQRGADELAALLYTSGTTGFPKGVMLSSRAIITNVLQTVARFGMIERQRVLAILPLFHSFAQNVCLWASVLAGCTVIVVPKIERRTLLEGLALKPTIFVGVPALYGLLCLLKKVPLESVRYFFCGGDVLPDKIRAGFQLLYGRKICCGYGLTEAAPVVAAEVEDELSPTACAGRPLVNQTCLIVDDDGHQVPAGTIGNLIVKGDNVMMGYYREPELTRQTLKDGFLYTGDLAYLDGRGRLIITGRVKDLIKHKGINVYPAEIENIILMHPLVVAVGVIGVDDPSVGQVPVAYVQVRAHEAGIEDVLKKLCADHLAAYKVPRSFVCSTEVLPMLVTGKVDKKVLRQRVSQTPAV